MLNAADGLLQQLSAFEPSSITAVPAFFTLLMQRHELYLEAARTELSTSEAAAAATASDMDRAALIATRRTLGARLVHVAMGGAVVPRSTLLFMERCVGIGGLGGGNCIVANGCAQAETTEPTQRPHAAHPTI